MDLISDQLIHSSQADTVVLIEEDKFEGGQISPVSEENLVCRTCLSKLPDDNSHCSVHDMVQIDLEDCIIMALSEIITQICLVLIQPNDHLPDQVCLHCRNNLISAYQMRLLALKVDAQLRSKVEYSDQQSVTLESESGREFGEDSIEDGFNDDHQIHKNQSPSPVLIKQEMVESIFQEELNKEDIELEAAIEDEEEGSEDEGQLDENGGRKKHHLPCDVCGKVFYKMYNLNRHKNVHNESKPFECETCKMRFGTESLLVRHSVVHTSFISDLTTLIKEKPTIFKCIECGKEFQKQESLSSHMKIHRASLTLKEFKCDFCPKVFQKLNLLTRHAKCHDQNKSHQCNICGKTFAHGGLLIDHINKHKGLKPHVCEICHKGFRQSCTLKDHMRTHNGEAPFLCSECGKSFNNGSNLRQHILRHTGQKSFACNQCPSKFVCKGSLKSHLATHTGLKPYVCDSCGSSFTKPYSLAKHKRIHTGERPYACDVCQMRFNSSDHVKRHMRTHTGEKPYKCKYCDRAFAQSNDLVKHTRSHVGDNTYQCSQCSKAFRLQSELRTHVQEHFLRQKGTENTTMQDALHELLVKSEAV